MILFPRKKEGKAGTHFGLTQKKEKGKRKGKKETRPHQASTGEGGEKKDIYEAAHIMREGKRGKGGETKLGIRRKGKRGKKRPILSLARKLEGRERKWGRVNPASTERKGGKKVFGLAHHTGGKERRRDDGRTRPSRKGGKKERGRNTAFSSEWLGGEKKKKKKKEKADVPCEIEGKGEWMTQKVIDSSEERGKVKSGVEEGKKGGTTNKANLALARKNRREREEGTFNPGSIKKEKGGQTGFRRRAHKKRGKRDCPEKEGKNASLSTHPTR